MRTGYRISKSIATCFIIETEPTGKEVEYVVVRKLVREEREYIEKDKKDKVEYFIGKNKGETLVDPNSEKGKELLKFLIVLEYFPEDPNIFVWEKA